MSPGARHWTRQLPMSTEVWIYEGRNSQAQAFWKFQDARREQDRDNGATLEEMIENAENSEWVSVPDFGGSEKDGYFYIDDGGSIHKVTVQ